MSRNEQSPSSGEAQGRLAAVGAYWLWGVLPVYWKAMGHIPAIEILAHRMAWTLVFTVILLSIRSHWSWLYEIRASPRRFLTFVASAFFLGINWFTYVFAVNSGHIVEASLGYFINPLFSVVLGVVFLHERLRKLQWAAVGIALIGVAHLTYHYGHAPWIALTLALTFGLYGLLRKTAPLASLTGLSLEMMFLLVPAVVFLMYLESQGRGHFGHDTMQTDILLISTGAATALPLLLFAYGAKRIRLATIGILQYIAPTLQFLIGVFIYNEIFTTARFISFCFIWVALGLYTSEGFVYRRRGAVPSPQLR